MGQAIQFTRAQPPAARGDGTTTKNRSAKDSSRMPIDDCQARCGQCWSTTAPSGPHGVTKIEFCPSSPSMVSHQMTRHMMPNTVLVSPERWSPCPGALVPWGKWENGLSMEKWGMGKGTGKWSPLAGFQGSTGQSIRRRQPLSFCFSWTNETKNEKRARKHELQSDVCKQDNASLHQQLYIRRHIHPSHGKHDSQKTPKSHMLFCCSGAYLLKLT